MNVSDDCSQPVADVRLIDMQVRGHAMRTVS